MLIHKGLESIHKQPAADSKDPFFLQERSLGLLFFGGKGGTGKTTCASATALLMAKRLAQSSFLLVSTDPAHSLNDRFNGTPIPANLKVLELDCQKSLSAFKHHHKKKLLQIASRGTFLDEDDIEQMINLSLPGLDELMAFLEICQWVHDGTYDSIIVDTAPTGHTLRLLAMPELIQRWLGALDALLAKHRYMRQVFAGAYKKDGLDEFLCELDQSIKQMETLIRNPARCRFVPVMLAEALSIQETSTLLDELARSDISAVDIIVNRLFPKSSCSCQVCAHLRCRQLVEINRFREKYPHYLFWGLPMICPNGTDPGSVEIFEEEISRLKICSGEVPATPCDVITAEPVIDSPGNAPNGDMGLLFFAGKGGVGKTTLACATATRLARDYPDKKILILSTDPAHSLSACFDMPIGSQPCSVMPGLQAMEIDAQGEFEGLKDQYAQELSQFFGAMAPNIDLTFDRTVMERFMDLSPPGLDEVMALTLMMDHWVSDRYDTLILDCAPTGHLIRLMETPELIDQWLKVVFNIFLKYRDIFKLPRITSRLIKISRNLKFLREILADTERCALYAVTILRHMAFEETTDLLRACNRIGAHVPQLLINLATTNLNQPLCSALHAKESKIRHQYEQSFTAQKQTVIYRWIEPNGVQQLVRLGRALFL